jgi:hypothetical protein
MTDPRSLADTIRDELEATWRTMDVGLGPPGSGELDKQDEALAALDALVEHAEQNERVETQLADAALRASDAVARAEKADAENARLRDVLEGLALYSASNYTRLEARRALSASEREAAKETTCIGREDDSSS